VNGITTIGPFNAAHQARNHADDAAVEARRVATRPQIVTSFVSHGFDVGVTRGPQQMTIRNWNTTVKLLALMERRSSERR
jgi:hypothetical protein